jgi:hypothetical protein
MSALTASHTESSRCEYLSARLAGARTIQTIDTRWVFLASSTPTGTGSTFVFWERSGPTHNRWKTLPSASVVSEPAYSSFLAAGGVCGTGFSRIIPVSRHHYLGSTAIGNRLERQNTSLVETIKAESVTRDEAIESLRQRIELLEVLRDMKSAERMTRIVQKATEPVNGL